LPPIVLPTERAIAGTTTTPPPGPPSYQVLFRSWSSKPHTTPTTKRSHLHRPPPTGQGYPRQKLRAVQRANRTFAASTPPPVKREAYRPPCRGPNKSAALDAANRTHAATKNVRNKLNRVPSIAAGTTHFYPKLPRFGRKSKKTIAIQRTL